MKISIISVAFNDCENLIKTFSSVKHFIGDDIEWVVVDGGSRDGTVEFLEAISQPSITYISEGDDGIYHAMNKGVDLASGDYFLFLNAGDVLLSETAVGVFGELVSTEQSYDAIICGAFLEFPFGKKVYREPRCIEQYIWHSMPASHQAIFYSSKVFEKIKYDETYRICGDYDLTSRMSLLFRDYLNVDKPLVGFSIGGVSYQRPIDNLVESVRVQKNVLNISFLKVFVSFLKRVLSIFMVKLIMNYCRFKGRLLINLGPPGSL